MGSRFFLVPFLPPLVFDEQPELSLYEVDFFLRLNLSANELSIVHQLQAHVDLNNVRHFFMGQPMTVVGHIPHDLLREQLENNECTLPGVPEFCALYQSPEDRATHSHELTRLFLENIPKDWPKFIQNHFRIEHMSRHLMAYLRATATGEPYPISHEELGFDVTDHNTWPEPFSQLFTMWNSRHDHPRELDTAISAWKFETAGCSIADSAPFSLDQVLAYLIQLRILEARREMNDPIHTKTLERIVEAVT